MITIRHRSRLRSLLDSIGIVATSKEPREGQTAQSKTLSDRGHSLIQWAGDQDVALALRSRQKFFLDFPFYRTH